MRQHLNNLPLREKYLFFRKKGYSTREIFFKGIRWSLINRINTIITPSSKIGKGVMIDVSAVLDGAKFMEFGDYSNIQRGAWLSVPLIDIENIPKKSCLIFGRNVRVGPNNVISASNSINIADNVLLGPNVTVLDHRHKFSTKDMPVGEQKINTDGSVIIGEGSWIGTNSVIYGGKKGGIKIGKNCVIAANTFVDFNVPDYSLVANKKAIVTRPIK